MHATLPDILTIASIIAGAGALTVVSAILARELWIAARRTLDRMVRTIRTG